MKPLAVLVTVFLVALIITEITQGYVEFGKSGRIAMAVMLVFTSFGHFKYSKGMSLMIPKGLPYKNEIVSFTGFIELAAAVGLSIPSLQRLTAWLLIVFFILIVPANIYAAMNRVDYEKGTYDGPGLGYLWFRIPLQILFVAWVYQFAIKEPTL